MKMVLNFNPNSLTVCPNAKLEKSLANAEPTKAFQFIRNGYFCVDSKDSKEDKQVWNRIVGLKSSYKPAN